MDAQEANAEGATASRFRRFREQAAAAADAVLLQRMWGLAERVDGLPCQCFHDVRQTSVGTLMT